MRRELLDAYTFDSLREARTMIAEYRWDYNHERPHKALGYLSPILFARKNQPNNEPKADDCADALSTNPRRRSAALAEDAV